MLVISGVVLGVLLAAWSGTRMLRSGEMSGGGAADMLGGAIDVFDPGKSRADRDLAEEQNKSEIVPSPDPLDRPLRVDLRTGRATVRRPALSPVLPGQESNLRR